MAGGQTVFLLPHHHPIIDNLEGEFLTPTPPRESHLPLAIFAPPAMTGRISWRWRASDCRDEARLKDCLMGR